MTPIRTLVDRDQDKLKPGLPPGLKDLYGGDLHFQTAPAERPFVFANFVSTLDGVVSYAIKGQASGSAVSGSDPADRFIMGLLRASADAIIVGSRTVHDTGPQSLWTAESIYPDAKHLYAEYRINVLHKPPRPLLVIVSGTGKLELGRAIFRTPEARTVVMTTPAGRDALTKAGAANCLPFRYTLLIPVLERSTRWRCCDCSRRSMGYEVSSTKAGRHFSENLWQHKLSTNSFLPCRLKSRAERLTQCGLRS